MSADKYLLLNGKVLQEELAFVSPANRGIMYGDGCFETLRAYEGKFLRLEAHFQRLKAGCEYLGMDLSITSSELREQVYNLLNRNKLTSKQAIVRIQCWRNGDRGYKTVSRDISWIIQTKEYEPTENPMNLQLAETRCIPNQALDRKFKLSNGLNYIQAAREIKNTEYDDAIMLTVQNKISETTSANLFWIEEEKVFTPAIDCDLLPGITRLLVIELCQKLGVDIEQGAFDYDKIGSADAAFCTNSVIEMRQVKKIGNQSYQMNHMLFLKLLEAYERFKMSELV